MMRSISKNCSVRAITVPVSLPACMGEAALKPVLMHVIGNLTTVMKSSFFPFLKPYKGCKTLEKACKNIASQYKAQSKKHKALKTLKTKGNPDIRPARTRGPLASAMRRRSMSLLQFRVVGLGC